MKWFALTLLMCAMTLFAGVAFAHKPSDAHLTVVVEGARVDVRADLALRDLDWAIGLDRDGDGAITWGEVRAARADIESYALKRLALSSGGVCPLRAGALEITPHSDGTYAVLRLAGECARAPESLQVDYSMFFAEDPLHRGLLRVEGLGDPKTEILSSDRRSVTLSQSTTTSGFTALLRSGVVHIFTGYDHLLFLCALLLPSVLRRKDSTWQPLSAREAMSGVVQIVTAFTIAHSITLALGAFSIVSPPSRVVESAIAASVVVAALDNLFGFLRVDRWVVPFGLGLIHGFGFSSTLTDLGLRGKSLGAALLGFNLGVELGQLACVALFLPLAYLARGTRAYPRVALRAGSFAIAVIAMAWFVERAFALQLPWSARG